MKRKLISSLLALMLLLLVILPVYAAISGVFNFTRGSIILSGVIRGLGNTNKNEVITVLDATAQVYALCQNKGGNIAPGRNPISLTLNVQSEPLQADRNGVASVNIVIDDPSTFAGTPVSPTPKQAGCPNGNWKVVGIQPDSVRWVSTKVVVLKNGSQELVKSYSCNDDGATLTCNEN